MTRVGPGILVLLGVALILVANGLAIWTARTSDVPNDPNIGAGLLGLAGFALLIVGVARWFARRRSGA